MSFFIIGIVLLAVSIYFLRAALKKQDREGIIGMTALLIASIILIVFFGIFYNVFI